MRATRQHAIAVISGDGIGREVTPAALEVLEAAGRAHGFELRLTEHPWGCDHFVETGRMMPADALDTLRHSDAILLGAVGRPDVPDHVSLWGLLIPIRRAFRQYVNLRPVRLWPAPGILSFAAFAWALTQSNPAFAGRAYAAYGGIYIGSALLWLLFVEGVMPDRWDILGALLCVAGALLIIYGPR